MTKQNEAVFPFENGKLQIIYENDCFLIAAGKVKSDDNSKISIGVRWCVSNLSSGIKHRGFPYMQGDSGITKCWFIIPNDLAIYLLMGIKDRKQNVIENAQNKIYEVLQILIKQEQERVNAQRIRNEKI